MTKNTKLVWRLGERPTPAELIALVNNKIITQEEAKEILLKEEANTDRDEKSLKTEIEFLRKLVEKLSDRSQIITTIKEIEVPYRTYPWYNPYVTWSIGCSDNYTCYTGTTSNNFSDIKTF